MKKITKRSIAVVAAVAMLFAPTMVSVTASASGNVVVIEDTIPPAPVTEPTAATIENPAAAVTFVQAEKSVVANIQQVARQVETGAKPATYVAEVNLGNYSSISTTTAEAFENANVDVELTYRYAGKTYKVRIPKGYTFDKDIPWYGPLYLYSLFGESVE